MTIQRMEHVGVVVDDLAAATAFFGELGLELQGGGGQVEGGWVDRIVGLEDVRVSSHAPANTPLRRLLRLCYVRGPEGIIVELAEQLA